MSQVSLYEKYGGAPTVSTLVQNFYTKVLESEQISHYFEGINMERLMNHQVKLFSMVMGGPVDYDLSRLGPAHKGFNLEDDDFDEVVDLLTETLEDADVSEEDIAQVMATVASVKSQIVTA